MSTSLDIQNRKIFLENRIGDRLIILDQHENTMKYGILEKFVFNSVGELIFYIKLCSPLDANDEYCAIHPLNRVMKIENLGQ